jgi:methionyl-tRNA formyltransferase
LRLVFLGTPPEAALALRALQAAGHDIPLVVTQPDRRRGRGGDTSPSPVKAAAVDLGLPVRTPERAVEVLDEIRGSGAALGVVVAFGQLIPPDLLTALPHGYVNIHYSLLPRWRGAAPVERAIEAGDAATGISLMQLEEGLDTGPVYAEERVTIGPDETAGELRARLADLGARFLVDHVEAVPTTTPAPQEGEPTYAKKLTPEEFHLDWGRPAADLARAVRAANPNPGAWTEAQGRRLKVWRAHAEPSEGTQAPGTLSRPARVATARSSWTRSRRRGSSALPATSGVAAFAGIRSAQATLPPTGRMPVWAAS